jgi:hypothetical protein
MKEIREKLKQLEENDLSNKSFEEQIKIIEKEYND